MVLMDNNADTYTDVLLQLLGIYIAPKQKFALKKKKSKVYENTNNAWK